MREPPRAPRGEVGGRYRDTLDKAPSTYPVSPIDVSQGAFISLRVVEGPFSSSNSSGARRMAPREMGYSDGIKRAGRTPIGSCSDGRSASERHCSRVQGRRLFFGNSLITGLVPRLPLSMSASLDPRERRT